MPDGRRIAITGISSHWGAAIAARLERDPSVEYLAGIDSRPPPPGLERTDYIEADVRSPVLSRLLPQTGVDTVVHCGILWYPEPGRPPRALHEINVIGTLQLLAACERTETLRPGGRPRLGGDLRLRAGRAVVLHRGPRAGRAAALALPARHLRARGVLRQLRPPPPRARLLHAALPAGDRRRSSTARCVRYLTLPVVPIQLGFDPRLQLLHADDALGALEAAIANPVRGAGQRRARRVDLAEPGAAAARPPGDLDPAAAVRHRDRPRQRAARRRRPGRRRDPAAALRPRRRQHPAARGDRLRRRPTTPSGRSATSPQERRARGSARACTSAPLAGRLDRDQDG